MKNTFLKSGIVLSDKQINQFEKYYELLLFYNEKFNITAITEREEVINKHFVDSALGVDILCGKTLIDVGSGGGFPAIPIKILKPDLQVTMVEATGKKCEFLRAVVKELDLNDVMVINDRAEILGKNLDFREKFDLVTARAVARLNSLCEYCMPLVKVGGKFVAYKGDVDEEVNEASRAVKTLGGKIVDVKKYELFGAKRALVSIEKITLTDKKYPRGQGKERKNPL